MIDEQSSASEHDYATDRSAIGAGGSGSRSGSGNGNESESVFDIMTHVLTSWRTCLRHDELVYVMTCFWRHDALFDAMTNFWHHDVFLMPWRTFWSHDVYLDVMTNSLTSWRVLTSWHTFWRHDVFLMSWRVFDIMTFFMPWRTF